MLRRGNHYLRSVSPLSLDYNDTPPPQRNQQDCAPGDESSNSQEFQSAHDLFSGNFVEDVQDRTKNHIGNYKNPN